TDVEHVLESSRRAVEFARSGQGPVFLESRTSRWPGNYGSSPTLSPPADLAARWAEESDPVQRLARRLVEAGEASPHSLADIDRQVSAEIQRAVEEALSSPEPA